MSSDALETMRCDPVLGPLVDRHGDLSISPAEDTFRRLLRSIVSQQVSTASATAIRRRLYDAFEITPAALRDAPIEELRAVGLSRQKAEYVRNVAEAYDERGLSRAYFEGMSDEAVIEELTGIRGVGVWTAKMYLMFCLGREDVFPVEDLGIRKGMRTLFDADMDRTAMRERADRWSPHRSLASRYVWRVVD